MKKFIALVLLLNIFGLTNSMVANETLPWLGWNQGFVKAQNEGKIALIDTAVSGRDLLGALSQGRSSGYPTTYFYVPAKNAMYQYPGYMNAADFGKVLDDMILANTTTPSENSGEEAN